MFKHSKKGIYGERSTDPHMVLWKAVILQAFADMASQSKNRELQIDKELAKIWVFSNSKDFYMVCDLANYHPDDIRKKAKEIIKNGLQWRAPAGKGARYEERKKYREKMKYLFTLDCQESQPYYS